MHANNQLSADWTAATGAPWGAAFGYPDRSCPPAADRFPGPRDQLGGDLLAFLSDFRTASDEEAERARHDVEQRAPGRARRRTRDGGTAGAGDRAGSGDERDDPYQGSDFQPAPDWWVATDGRWYRPELHPDARPSPDRPDPA